MFKLKLSVESINNILSYIVSKFYFEIFGGATGGVSTRGSTLTLFPAGNM